MHDLQLNPTELKKLLQREMKQSYIEKYIQKPFIDESKILLLTKMSTHIALAKKDKEKLLITIMLVQIALDTHERIPINNSDDMTETEKQLSVLAGDYYSGLYYYLLAEINQIEMIQILARAIKEINEYKMHLYYKENLSIQNMIDYLNRIDALLLVRVAEFYEINPTFIDLIKETSKFNQLQYEIKLFQENRSIESQFKQVIEIKHMNEETLYQTILQASQKSETKIEDLMSSLTYICHSSTELCFKNLKAMYSTSYVEEG